jgi:arylsulfatase B
MRHHRMKYPLIVALLMANLCNAQQPNILLVIADDMGLDPVPGYLPGPTKAAMPNLEALMANGLTFDNAWADPLCSPTRATILTGRYGLHTGVLNANNASLLPPEETTLHQYLNDINSGFTSCLIGKWHLGGASPDPTYPNTMGIPHYAGLLTGTANSYFNWDLTTNGITAPNTTYITTTFTDLALDWIGEQSEPWFCWLAYNAPHTPLHRPPLYMHSQGALPTDQASINANPLPYYLAMCESVDYELGRLLSTLDPAILANTVVIFIGDNGTDANVIQAPYLESHAKGTLYEGGVRVPLVMAGPGISRAGEHEAALVNSSDLFTTIVELTGHALPIYENSRSLVPMLDQDGLSVRDCAYTEVLGGNGGFAYRNAHYKFIDPTLGPLEFYDLLLDPWEMNNLLPGPLSADEQLAYDQLSLGCDLSTGGDVLHPIRFSCHPNPVEETLVVEIDGTKQVPYSVRNNTGVQVLHGTLVPGRNRIPLDHLPAGLYHLICANGRHPVVKL